MMPQSTFMVTAVIDPARKQELQSLLDSMNSAPGFANPHNALLPWHQLAQLHVARFTILEARTNDDMLAHGVQPSAWPPTLCFVGDIDGDPDLFLAELVVRAEPGLRQIFSCCQGCAGDRDDLLQWLQQHRQSAAATYVNWRGRTLRQIREEQALAVALGQEARRLREQFPRLQAQELRERLRHFAEGEVVAGRLRLSPDGRAPVGWYLRNALHLAGVPLLLLALSPLLIVAAPFYFRALRQLEVSDPENTEPAEPDHLRQLTAQEDIDVSNHFNVFGQVKPGLLRLLTIRLGLLLLDYSARHVYNRGHLTRVRTIHFARWVLLDDDRRLYFASNYDGSADTYMDDFINKVAWGLNLVFSNGVGYPRTRWLLKGGARSEENYRRTLRRNQLPTQSWYKAYPGLTAVDLARNTRIRRGLQAKNPGSRETGAWLALL